MSRVTDQKTEKYSIIEIVNNRTYNMSGHLTFHKTGTMLSTLFVESKELYNLRNKLAVTPSLTTQFKLTKQTHFVSHYAVQTYETSSLCLSLRSSNLRNKLTLSLTTQFKLTKQTHSVSYYAVQTYKTSSLCLSLRSSNLRNKLTLSLTTQFKLTKQTHSVSYYAAQTYETNSLCLSLRSSNYLILQARI